MTNRIQIDRILCPVDFSVFSTRALRHAAALARRFEARLVVLHVVPQWQPYANMPAYLPAPMLANPVLCAQVERDVSNLVADVVAGGVPVETVVREAEPWREILTVAGEKAVDLIVMGTHGRGGFEHLLMGSVAEKVLNRATCPVVTVCHEEGRTWEAPGLVRNILCATDLSPASGPTIRYALSLAAEFQCRLTLLHVLDGLANLDSPAYAHLPPPVAVLDQHEELARRQLREAIDTDARAWCSVDERIVPGRAAEEILRVAAQTEADLIVIGGHRHASVARAVLGSASQSVVRAASCPVLTVRRMPNEGALALQVSDQALEVPS
ncbi:MAG: universal stress protein [Vicinamibacteria bacterium]